MSIQEKSNRHSIVCLLCHDYIDAMRRQRSVNTGRRITLGKKLLFTAILAVLCLAAAEVILRCVSPVRLGFEYDGKRFMPPKEFDRDETVNQYGFHDVEHGPKRPGTKRILLLGDSYVEAGSVEISATIGQRLAHYSKTEVVACGRSAWGQRQPLELLQQYSAEIDPDLVISLFLPFNDVSDNSEVLKAKAWDQLTRMNQVRPGWVKLPAQRAPLFIVPWSRLNQLISHRLGVVSVRREKQIPLDYFVYSVDYDYVWHRAWQDTEALLLATRDVSRRIGAKYVIVSASTPHGVLGRQKGLERLQKIYPGMRDRQWDLDGPNRRLAPFCEANDIAFLSLEPAFRVQTKKGRRLHWKFDGHWNAAGNDLAGRLIAEFIEPLE